MAAEPQLFSTSEMTAKAGRVLVMYTHATKPTVMWAGTNHGGLWHSHDGGTSWAQVDDVPANLPVAAITADPAQPDILFAGSGNGRDSAPAARGRGIYRSADGGGSWMLLPLTDPEKVGEPWSHVHSISINRDGVILAATSDNSRNGYIFRSVDGGQSWGLFPVYAGSAVGKHNLIHKVRFDPEQPDNAVFMDDYANLTYSSDAGASWSVVRKSSSTCK